MCPVNFFFFFLTGNTRTPCTSSLWLLTIMASVLLCSGALCHHIAWCGLVASTLNCNLRLSPVTFLSTLLARTPICGIRCSLSCPLPILVKLKAQGDKTFCCVQCHYDDGIGTFNAAHWGQSRLWIFWVSNGRPVLCLGVMSSRVVTLSPLLVMWLELLSVLCSRSGCGTNGSHDRKDTQN